MRSKDYHRKRWFDFCCTTSYIHVNSIKYEQKCYICICGAVHVQFSNFSTRYISHLMNLYLRGFDDDFKSGVLHCTTHVCRCAHNRQHTPVSNSNTYFWLIDWSSALHYQIKMHQVKYRYNLFSTFTLLVHWMWSAIMTCVKGHIPFIHTLTRLLRRCKYSSSCVFVICIQK